MDPKTPHGRDLIMTRFMAPLERSLGNLFGRWMDEKDHEDFAGYAKVMQSLCGEGFTFIKASKRPFGFVVQPTGFPYQVQVYHTTKLVGWKSLKRNETKKA